MNPDKIKSLMISIMIFFSGVFLTLSIEIVFEQPIRDFYFKTILGETPDIAVTLNSNLYIKNENFINISDFNRDLIGKRIYYYNKLSADPSNTDLFEQLLNDKNELKLASDILYIPTLSLITPIESKNGSIKTCSISIPQGTIGPKSTKNYRIFYSLEGPPCEKCIENSISIVNKGNSKATEFRLNLCTEGSIEFVDGQDFYPSFLRDCLQIRRDKLLTNDKIEGEFTIKFASEEEMLSNIPKFIKTYEVEADGKSISENKISRSLNVVIPNCTTLLKFEEIQPYFPDK